MNQFIAIHDAPPLEFEKLNDDVSVLRAKQSAVNGITLFFGTPAKARAWLWAGLAAIEASSHHE
jgi:hypothetical protein